MSLDEITRRMRGNRVKRFSTSRCLREKEKPAKGLRRPKQVNVVSWQASEASIKGKKDLIMSIATDRSTKLSIENEYRI